MYDFQPRNRKQNLSTLCSFAFAAGRWTELCKELLLFWHFLHHLIFVQYVQTTKEQRIRVWFWWRRFCWEKGTIFTGINLNMVLANWFLAKCPRSPCMITIYALFFYCSIENRVLIPNPHEPKANAQEMTHLFILFLGREKGEQKVEKRRKSWKRNILGGKLE